MRTIKNFNNFSRNLLRMVRSAIFALRINRSFFTFLPDFLTFRIFGNLFADLASIFHKNVLCMI